ncbi:MAG: lysophospholipase [Gemmataceae bacterium]|nr:lysophospholipase [Gemmataceae bacterium]
MRSSRTFAPLLPALAPWTPQAFDHRGHGAAPWAASYLVADYAADAMGLVREPCILYGHSLGALVAACVAAESPHPVAVILEDPPSPAFLADVDATAYGKLFRDFQAIARRKDKSVSELAADLRALNLPRDAASLRLSARMLAELDPAALDPLIGDRWLEGIDLHAVLKRIRCPVLLLQADEAAGGMLSDLESGKMLACIEDATPARFAGAGHQLHWLATEALLRHVLAFLESLG